MCQCHQIGGPFIGADPDCPTHGTEAQESEARREGRFEALERRVAALEAALEAVGINVPED